MQNLNIFHGNQNLLRAPINPGGLCWILFFNIHDVFTWPEIDPQNGVINSDIILKGGAKFYTLQTSEKGRVFKENLKYTTAGPLTEMEVAGTIPGNTLNHIVGVGAMQFNRFGILVKERNGEQRLIGNQDAGAIFEHDYSSGDIFSSRQRNIKFSFSSHIPAPIYNSGNIVADTAIIPIGGGGGGSNGGTVAGSFQLHTRFEVGKPGAPMLAGDVVYNHSALANKNVIVFADGLFLPQVQTVSRHIIKTPGSGQITFYGGVIGGEAIEIFIY